MASSVALGFAALADGSCDAAWLWPVDHPDVTVGTLRTLAARLGAHDAARPVVDGAGGHPPLIARQLWPRLAGCADLEGGARAVLAAAATVDVGVDDRGCVRDVDTVLDVEPL
jgi:CTP:molybdopterin cytidylyltransferase MocA